MKKPAGIEAGFVLFLAIIVSFVVIIKSDLGRFGSVDKENRRLRSESEEQDRASVYYKKRLLQLKNMQVIELLARKNMGLVKKGETAYKVILK